MNSTLNEIEALLRSHHGYVSGESIAGKLGISRAAVWKHIRALKEQGFGIESFPKKGYLLVSCPDILSKSAIASRLSGNLGGVIDIVPYCDSTNNLLRQLGQEGAPHGSVILAEQQAAGKGRLQRDWFTAEKSIAMSVLLRPNMPSSECYKLAIIAAIALVYAVREVTGLQTSIKWPNDILLGGKKLCGLSLYMSAEQDALYYVVLGIGVNVNMADFPSGLEPIATSLQICLGAPADRNELVACILNRLSLLLDEWPAHGFAGIMRQYRPLSCTLGQDVDIIGSSTLSGHVEGFDDDGLLLLKTSDGSVKQIISGDVSLRSRV